MEQWNGIQCTGGDVIMLITCYYYYGCLLWMFANASRKNDASIIYPGLLATFKICIFITQQTSSGNYSDQHDHVSSCEFFFHGYV